MFELKYNVDNDKKIKMKWNRNCAYLESIFLINCLRTYIAQSRIYQKKEGNEIRCSQNNYLSLYTSENIYIFRYILSK